MSCCAIKRLPANATEAAVFEVLNSIASVATINIVRDAVTRASLGYAFVSFHTGRTCPLAGLPVILAAASQEGIWIRGQRVRVQAIDKQEDIGGRRSPYSLAGGPANDQWDGIKSATAPPRGGRRRMPLLRGYFATTWDVPFGSLPKQMKDPMVMGSLPCKDGCVVIEKRVKLLREVLCRERPIVIMV